MADAEELGMAVRYPHDVFRAGFFGRVLTAIGYKKASENGDKY